MSDVAAGIEFDLTEQAIVSLDQVSAWSDERDHVWEIEIVAPGRGRAIRAVDPVERLGPRGGEALALLARLATLGWFRARAIDTAVIEAAVVAHALALGVEPPPVRLVDTWAGARTAAWDVVERSVWAAARATDRAAQAVPYGAPRFAAWTSIGFAAARRAHGAAVCSAMSRWPIEARPDWSTLASAAAWASSVARAEVGRLVADHPPGASTPLLDLFAAGAWPIGHDGTHFVVWFAPVGDPPACFGGSHVRPS